MREIQPICAVADETRLKILKRLSRGGVCACRLPKLTGKSQPNVSKHLRILLTAGLAEMRKDGTKRIYSLSCKGRKILSDVSKW